MECFNKIEQSFDSHATPRKMLRLCAAIVPSLSDSLLFLACDRLDCNSSFMSLQRGGILTKNTEEKRRWRLCHTLGHLAVTGLARIMIDRSVTKGRSEVSILLHSTLYTAPSLVGTHSNGMPNITEPNEIFTYLIFKKFTNKQVLMTCEHKI